MADLIEQTVDTVTIIDDTGAAVLVNIVALIDPDTDEDEGYDLWLEAGDAQICLNEGDCLYEQPGQAEVQAYYDETTGPSPSS